MPEMSGLEVLEVLRKNEKFSKLKVFAYTALAQEDELNQLQNLGFDAILLKPLTSQKLIKALNDN
jgi:CheY-like chemotaxis protein